MKKARILTFLLTGVLIATAAFFGACGSVNSENNNNNDNNNNDNNNNPSDVIPQPAGTKTYVFEAEDVFIADGYVGPGYSGAAYGKDIIQNAVVFNGSENVNELGASNDYYVTYLFGEGATLAFELVSSKAVETELVLRIAGEFNLTLTNTEYTVEINGVALQYQPALSVQQSPKGPGNVGNFKDVSLGKINLVEGENTIKLITSNRDVSIFNGAGTYGAKAPVVDCIKLIATDEAGYSLDWNAGKGYPFKTNY